MNRVVIGTLTIGILCVLTACGGSGGGDSDSEGRFQVKGYTGQTVFSAQGPATDECYDIIGSIGDLGHHNLGVSQTEDGNLELIESSGTVIIPPDSSTAQFQREFSIDEVIVELIAETVIYSCNISSSASLTAETSGAVNYDGEVELNCTKHQDPEYTVQCNFRERGALA